MVNENGEALVDTLQGVQITGCIEVFGNLEKDLVRKSWETGEKGANSDGVLRAIIQV